MMDECTYQKMDWEIRRNVLNVCLCDQLFCVVYQALQEAETESGLSPEEVWCEALGVMQRIVRLPRPEIAFRQEKSYLLARYDTFACADGSHTVRGQEPARQTVCTVFTTLLFMLAAASGQISSNPYRKLCIGIARDLDGNPLYKSLYARIRASEKEEEQEGRYVDVQDYATHDAPAGTQKETHTLEVDELVETVCGMHSAACYEQVIQVLSRYNDSHGHRFQQSVDKLRNRLDTLRRAASEPRMTEQVVVQKGGMNISRSHFEGTRFDIAKKSEEPAHQLLH